ncbi:GNAT family N-acetyltransferase [Brackiella oedipodis]|uniref:bifunctional acetate--CoA ligase family protein/GNAT family N-acetyltransferase n=1 Tax=Brackiella oedipodis TaxID=124225 RepID=UPI00049171A3|nr:GNAT family N-acetyltransferase [Brackiella oedipodis]
MYSHRLSSVFNPQSIVLIYNRPLEGFEQLPARLKSKSLSICLDTHDPNTSREALKAMGQYDLAAIYVEQEELDKALQLLEVQAPKSLLVLASNEITRNPRQDIETLRHWCQQHDCNFLGPRAFGVQRPNLGLNISKIEQTRAGRVAVVSQSRMIANAIMDWGSDIQVGFSTVVSLGEAGNIHIPDMLEFLAGDSQTDSVVLYLDKLSHGRELFSAMRMLASVKPLVIFRAGRSDPQIEGLDSVFDAVVRRAGAMRVNFFVEIYSVIKSMTHRSRPKGGRLAILGNSRGTIQLLWDRIRPYRDSIKLAQISDKGQSKLAEILSPGSIPQNPVVSYAPFTSQSLIDSLKLLVAEKNVDAILLILAPDDSSSMSDMIEDLAIYAAKTNKPILCTLFGEKKMRLLRHKLDAAGTPAFRTPETAFGGIHALIAYHYNQQLLQQVRIPLLLSEDPDKARALEIINQARQDQRQQLNNTEAAQLLQAYLIGEIRQDAILDTAQRHQGQEDFLPSVKIAVGRDEIFGPWIMFAEDGHNMSSGDLAVDLPPLNAFLAQELIYRSRVWRQELKGLVSPEALQKLQKTLELVGEMVTDVADICSLEISPIVIDGDELIFADVNVTLTENQQVDPLNVEYRHMTIYPYPSHLIQHRHFKDGTPWTVRPIRPEDADALQLFIRNLSEHSRYMRFVSMMTELTPKMLSRYTYVDYYKELALVATTKVKSEGEQAEHEMIIGFAHYLMNNDGYGAEYALVIADDWQRMGLGRVLMSQLLSEAKNQGLEYIEGFILSNNRAMLGLMTGLGLQNDPEPEDPTMRRVWMPF